ncbi:hypothetical protein SpCBS45565_g04788 [Spizellomyces sp. 'palustris']|nr:hypothetical protein SpCBS45565_g04788 [Spizellomyces sp. 'palustris']
MIATLLQAAAFLGGLGGNSDEPIHDPFLGTDIQTVNPPRLHASQQPPQQQAPHQHLYQSHLAPCSPLESSAPLVAPSAEAVTVQPGLMDTLPTVSFLQPPARAHPPTPISTLLAFRKQIKNDTAVEENLLDPVAVVDFAQELTVPGVEGLDSMSQMASIDFEDILQAWHNEEASRFPRSQPSTSLANAEWDHGLTEGSIIIPTTIPPLASKDVRPLTPRESHHSRGKGYVHKACVNCKVSHVACDVGRPCQRCVRSGKSDSCIDAERKRRGRPTNALKRVNLSDGTDYDDGMDDVSETGSASPIRKRAKRNSLSLTDSPRLDATLQHPPISTYPYPGLGLPLLSNALTAEIGTQLMRLQANMMGTDGALSDDVVQAVTALSMLLPGNSSFMGDGATTLQATDMSAVSPDQNATAAAVAAAAAALVAGFNESAMQQSADTIITQDNEAQMMDIGKATGDDSLMGSPPQSMQQQVTA